MNKNQLNDVELIDENTILYKTTHFDVSVSIPVRFNDSWNDGVLTFDYNVIRRTTYATNLQIKKFIQRTSMKLLLEYIHSLDKEFPNG